MVRYVMSQIMNYAEKRSRKEEAYGNNKNTKKKKSPPKNNPKSKEDNMNEINTTEINIGFKCYKCGQCNFQTLHKESLVHHSSFAHNIKLLNVEVKKQSEENIDVTVEDQTKDIMIDEGPLMSGVILEDQFENNMENEGSPGDSDSDTLNETMPSLPDISRSNSMERKSHSTSPSKSFIKNDQSVENLDMGELFPHLVKKDMSDESINLKDDIVPKPLLKHSSELSQAPEEGNQIIEDTATSSIGLTPNCSETDLSQPSLATPEKILPMIRREVGGEIINNEPRIKTEEAGEIIYNEDMVKGEEAEELIKNEPGIKREIIKNEPRIKVMIKNEPKIKVMIKNEARIEREEAKKVFKNEPRIKREEGGIIYSACPLCFKHWMMEELELHASECLGGGKEETILDGSGEGVKDGLDGADEEVIGGGDGTQRFLCGYCSTSVHEGKDEKRKHLISCRKNMLMKKWQEARQEKKNALRSRYKKEV